jgi:hypothetical protein
MSVDFRRLAQVRARRSTRRRRWIWVLATLGLAALLVAASQLAAPMLAGRPLASWLEQSVPFLGPGAAPVAEEAHGRVRIVEPAAGVIRVSSGFLGLMSVELVITPETLIVVGDKEGGFGDIRDGSHVRAAYEARPGSLHATRVEVVVHAP